LPPVTVTLRAVAEDDGPLLLRIYASTRADELALLPWADEDKERFVAMQHDAQDRHYSSVLPAMRRSIVLVDGRPAGRLYLDIDDRRMLVVDIALLPEHRRHGVGTMLLERVAAEADELRLPVQLHVDVTSPARRLYERLGFSVVEDGAVHLLMERPWPTSPA
jgi:ribosomal protein S18 acetylase RimI-like enzyme